MTEPTRGERNNNPGNIRHGDDWKGLSAEQLDGEYASFIAPEWGIRAIVRVLQTYQKRYGLKTLREMINRYAPHRGQNFDGTRYENPTDSYVKNAAEWSGVDADDNVDLSNRCVVMAVVRAIIRQENGRVDYDHRTIARGVDLALTGD